MEEQADEGKRLSRIGFDQRARTVFGKQFQQHDMRHPAIQNGSGLHALFDRINGRFDFRDHAAGDCAVGD